MRTKSTKTNTINVITLGCSKNIYDSEVLMGQLKANDKKVVHEKKGILLLSTPVDLLIMLKKNPLTPF